MIVPKLVFKSLAFWSKVVTYPDIKPIDFVCSQRIGLCGVLLNVRLQDLMERFDRCFLKLLDRLPRWIVQEYIVPVIFVLAVILFLLILLARLVVVVWLRVIVRLYVAVIILIVVVVV